jgi:lysophospholipase L1-like esterase
MLSPRVRPRRADQAPSGRRRAGGARPGPAIVARALAIVALLLGGLLLATPARGAGPSVGPKAYYLALGDSLAFGYQPDLDWTRGYADQWYAADLQARGSRGYTNYGCNGETSTTFIAGGCPYAGLFRSPYAGPQLAAAVDFIRAHPGKVSPVSLDIGANDVMGDLDQSTCAVSGSWDTDLRTLDQNLTGTILPRLTAALTNRRGARTGDLVLMNYYDPWQNQCPATLAYLQELNQHLAADAAPFGVPIADVFAAFGGAATPNPTICAYT